MTKVRTFFKSISLIFFVMSFFYLNAQSFKVGVYQNDPKVYVRKDGKPGGIFVDVLNEIAGRNGWELKYIKKEWQELTDMIDKNEIDILVDVSYSKERVKIMKFNKIELLRSWLQLYTLNTENIEHRSLLEGKNIGVLKGSVQEQLFSAENIRFKKIVFPSYKRSVEALYSREVDGIIVDRFFYFSELRRSDIVERPVIFRPKGLYYAFSKSVSDDIICRIDETIADLKNDSGSVFYSSLNRHMKVIHEENIPVYYYWLFFLLIIATAVFVVFTVLLKIQVNRKVLEIQKHSEEISKMDKLESIGLLAGGIAHDFNNLLTGVYGYLELAEQSSPNKERLKECIEKATKSLDRARALTFQLLTFAKGGAPVVKQEKIETFLEDIVRFSLAGSSCSPKFDFSKDLYSVKVDINQISQVIENIVINAKQAMPEGGDIQIGVQNKNLNRNHHPVLDEGKYVMISIKDKGVGIRRDLIGKIFDPFFTTKDAGSGIGLAASFSILKKHGGYIEVESELGVGSTFRIYLPASSIIPVEDDQTGKAEIHKGEGTVIVMDDDEIVRNILENMLENMNYKVISCINGNETIDTYKNFRTSGRNLKFMIFDLTISEGMGGLETIKKIRELDQDVPVFVSSGYADSNVISSPEEFGFTGSISKPFRMIELSRLLRKRGIN